MRSKGGLNVSKTPRDDQDVGRMEFLLTLRRRGIGDQAVLRAMDEVPRERFVEAEFTDNAYADQARERLRSLGYDNVDVVVGDGFAGVPGRAPYDRIIVTAAAEHVPQTLIDQLADDGVMLLPLGRHGGAQHIVKLTKSQTGVTRDNLIPVRFVPLLPGQAQEL